jgi:hypothetical protein
MSDVFGGLLGCVVFVSLAILARRFARWSIRSQNRFWGMRIRDDQEEYFAWIIRAVGVLGFALSIALLVQAT